MHVKDVFAEDIHRRIDEVIKVDALQGDLLAAELREYHPTESIREQLKKILEAYDSLRHAPTQDVGIWVSGFFGAGKSSFAKLVGVLLSDYPIGDRSAIDVFEERIGDQKITVLLRQVREHLPTHLVMFDILKDHIAGAGERPLTTVMYRALLRSLGYPMDLDLAELEIDLESRGALHEFESTFEAQYPGRSWSTAKSLVMTATNEASTVLHRMDPTTYPSADTWARSKVNVALTPKLLAERAVELSKRRAGGRKVLFVVDEIGQYAAAQLGRILDLNGIIESFSFIGQGDIWLLVTSQEKLSQVIDVYDAQRNQLVRLLDRFAHKVTLNPSDIREVASYRILRKAPAAEPKVRALYRESAGRLGVATKVTGAVRLPELEEDGFVDLYPLLPYQVDLLIMVVNGLRRAGGSATTMGGATRTIVKMAQELIISEKFGLATEEVGALVTLDAAYGLLEDNLPMELRQEVDLVDRAVDEPLTGEVARAIALLQFSEAIHTTEENLAAVLHPTVDADSLLPEVRSAVEALVKARVVRRTESGLKIQSAAERTWDEERDSRSPSPSDLTRLVKASLVDVWGKGAQAPNAQLGGWKRFTAGLRMGSEQLVPGDVTFAVAMTDPSREREEQRTEAKSLSQQSGHDAIPVWSFDLSEAGRRFATQLFRSDHMLRRGVRTPDEEPLLRHEQERKQDALKGLEREMVASLCRGAIYFRGQVRSPDDDATNAKQEARRVLGSALQEIYHRFDEADRKVSDADVRALFDNEHLKDLPGCYEDLGVVRGAGAQRRFTVDAGVAGAVLDHVKLRASQGRSPAGKELAEHFGAPPFGWPLELMKLCVAALLREGSITVTSSGVTISSWRAPEAKVAVTGNPSFRALTVHPRSDERLSSRELRQAARILEERFGLTAPGLTEEAVAGVIQADLCNALPTVMRIDEVLKRLALPGQELVNRVASSLQAIRSGTAEDAIRSLLAEADQLQTGIQRSRALTQVLSGDGLATLERATTVRTVTLPVLESELAEEDSALRAGRDLCDLLTIESFFEKMSAIRLGVQTVVQAYDSLLGAAVEERDDAVQRAVERLEEAPGWGKITDEQRDRLLSPLVAIRDDAPPDDAYASASPTLERARLQGQAVEAKLSDTLTALRKLVAPTAKVLRVGALGLGPIRSPEELAAVLETLEEKVLPLLNDADVESVILE